MYVDPSVRRTGIGRRVLAALEADAASRGAARMILTTGHPQIGAIALYRASGYADIASFGHYADIAGAVHLGKVLEVGMRDRADVGGSGDAPDGHWVACRHGLG
jgi:ribosomal protein S18 acetylase RimI-like enzyme